MEEEKILPIEEMVGDEEFTDRVEKKSSAI